VEGKIRKNARKRKRRRERKWDDGVERKAGKWGRLDPTLTKS